jgi:hypothetical protein
MIKTTTDRKEEQMKAWEWILFSILIIGTVWVLGSRIIDAEERIEILEQDSFLVKEHEAEFAKINAKIERWLKISGDHMSGMD